MTLRKWLAAEPFTLAMSSGLFGFFAHAGVLSVLESEGLLPVRAAGSSAGALVTGMWAAGMSSDAIVQELLRIQRRDFWDPALGLGVLRGRLFAEMLERILPVRTFGECRVPLGVSVFDLGTFKTRVISDGHLAPALRASCAVPGMFHPVRHDGRALYDGGILDRPGLLAVGQGERVFYHHLVSRLPLGAWQARIGRGLPKREQLVSFAITDLPRCDPFRLSEGRRIVDMAKVATRAALELPITNGHLAQP